MINLCTKRHNEFLIVLSLVEKQYSILCFVRQRIQSNLLCKFINSGSMYLEFIQGKKKCVRRTRFFFEIRSKAWFRARGCSENESFSTASGTMSFSLCLLELCNFCLADNHADQRIKFIIVRGWLSGGSIPALSITLSIHAILRPSFSMTSTPSISCTASPLSAPCTAFQ